MVARPRAAAATGAGAARHAASSTSSPTCATSPGVTDAANQLMRSPTCATTCSAPGATKSSTPSLHAPPHRRAEQRDGEEQREEAEARLEVEGEPRGEGAEHDGVRRRAARTRQPITVTEMRMGRGNSSPRRRSPTSAASITMRPSTAVRWKSSGPEARDDARRRRSPRSRADERRVRQEEPVREPVEQRARGRRRPRATPSGCRDARGSLRWASGGAV